MRLRSRPRVSPQDRSTDRAQDIKFFYLAGASSRKAFRVGVAGAKPPWAKSLGISRRGGGRSGAPTPRAAVEREARVIAGHQAGARARSASLSHPGRAELTSWQADRSRVHPRPGYHWDLRTKIAIWWSWLAFISLLTGRHLHWEIEYFRSPGPAFYRAVLLLLPLFLLSCGIYIQIRGNRVRRLEVPGLVLVCVAFLTAYQPLATLIAAVLFVSCVSTGIRIARLLRVPLETAVEVLALGFGFGCVGLMLVLFALGLAHALVPWLLWPALLLPIGLFPREASRGLGAVGRAIRSPANWPGFESPIAAVTVIFMAIAAACAIALAVTPSVAFDPLATHLAAAKYYAARHALEPLPSLDYSYFPQGCEILMALSYGSAARQPLRLSPRCFGSCCWRCCLASRESVGWIEWRRWPAQCAQPPCRSRIGQATTPKTTAPCSSCRRPRCMPSCGG